MLFVSLPVLILAEIRALSDEFRIGYQRIRDAREFTLYCICPYVPDACDMTWPDGFSLNGSSVSPNDGTLCRCTSAVREGSSSSLL